MAATLPTAPSLEQLLAEALRPVVREEIRAALETIRPVSGRRVLSRRAAAKMLGIDRGPALAALVDSGAIREVSINGRKGLRLEDVERVLSEGATVPQGSAPSGGSKASANALRAARDV